jgi:hypothetical protein
VFLLFRDAPSYLNINALAVTTAICIIEAPR